MIETSIEPNLVIIVGIAGRQSNRLDIGIQALGDGHDIQAITVRQTEIGEENMNVRLAQDLYCLRRGFRGDRRIPAASQKRYERLPRVLMVLHQKNLHIFKSQQGRKRSPSSGDLRR